MHNALRLVAGVVAVVVVILLIRTMAVTSYVVTSSGMMPSLLQGEGVLVNMWSYGLRSPFDANVRWCERNIGRGDVVVLNNPASAVGDSRRSTELLIGRCIAVPGDVVYVDTLFAPNGSRNENMMPLYLPQAGGYVAVKPWNIMLLCNTISLHEGCRARVEGDTLFVSGHQVRYAKLCREYYWIFSDNPADLSGSKIFGLVPKQNIIGRASRIWLPKSLGRFMKSIE